MREGLGYHTTNGNAPSLCRMKDDCTSDPLTFVLSDANAGKSTPYTADTWDDPIGLAKDGHIILAVHDSNGDNWQCDQVDACNGAFVGDDSDVYAYMTTSTFPYVLGCWGPAEDLSFEPTCTSNGCGGETETADEEEEEDDDDENEEEEEEEDDDDGDDDDDAENVDGDSAIQSVMASSAALICAAAALF